MSPLLIAHVGLGALGILSGAAAVSARKGERLHRAFGTVFFCAMLAMSALGAWLAAYGPHPGASGTPPQASISVGTLTFYLVATAWMTVRRRERGVGPPEWIAFLAVCGVAAALLTFGLRAAATPLFAPYMVFAAFAVFAAAMDLRVILTGGVAGVPRIARHLWRMCFALFFACAFFFLGQQKVMPAYMHGSPILVILALAPLALMAFWLIRVRIGDAFRDAPATS